MPSINVHSLRHAIPSYPGQIIREPMPSKTKWKHKKRYQRLRNRVQALETEVKAIHFRKHITTSIFAYHNRTV
jgi:hypothetical protein